MTKANFLKNLTEDFLLNSKNSDFQVLKNPEINSSTTSLVKENIEQAKNEFSEPLLPILDLNEESNMVSKEVDFFGSSSQSSNILDVNYDRENIDNLFFSVAILKVFPLHNLLQTR